MRATRVSSRPSVNKSTARCEESGFAHEFSDTWTRNTRYSSTTQKRRTPRPFFCSRRRSRGFLGPRPLTLRASRDHVASPPLDATSAAAVLPKALAANATPEPMSSQRLATHLADAEHHDSSGTHHIAA